MALPSCPTQVAVQSRSASVAQSCWVLAQSQDSGCGSWARGLQVKMPNNRESSAKPAIPTRASKEVEEGKARSGGWRQP
jgi:hypothetical protein